MTTTVPFDLERFIQAQSRNFFTALQEIQNDAKQSHWMWYIFPQIAGLGRNPEAQTYAIQSLDEARAYLAHPVLGARLRECVAALQALPPTKVTAVFGEIDAIKLRSSLTLFGEADTGPTFQTALDRWFSGKKDEATLRLLSQA